MVWPAIYKDTYLTEVSYKDAKEFMNAIFDFYYSRATLMDFLGSGVKRVIFRGVDDARHENLPRAFRTGLDWDRFDFYSPLPLDLAGGAAAKGNFLFDHRQVEFRSVVNFLKHADNLGIPTPLNFSILNKEMQTALGGTRYDFLTRNPPLDQPFPGEEVREVFALAQHYGTPTRLLDWTESPAIAMFFAASASWKSILADAIGYADHKRIPKSRQITVYGLGGSLIGKLDLLLVKTTRYQNPRLRAQAGVFVLDPYSDIYFMETGHWPSLEDRVRQLEDQEKGSQMRLLSPEVRLVKWNLAASESAALAMLLLDHNVSFETMFPSLESAALAFAYRQRIVPRSGS